MADRLQKLKELEAYLYASMQGADVKSIAPIAKQYRETIREIEEIEGTERPDDEISRILDECDADGVSRAVRPSRAADKRKRRAESGEAVEGGGIDS